MYGLEPPKRFLQKSDGAHTFQTPGRKYLDGAEIPIYYQFQSNLVADVEFFMWPAN